MSTGNGWGSSELIGVMFGAGGRDGERISDHLWRMLRQPVADNTSDGYGVCGGLAQGACNGESNRRCYWAGG